MTGSQREAAPARPSDHRNRREEAPMSDQTIERVEKGVPENPGPYIKAEGEAVTIK